MKSSILVVVTALPPVSWQTSTEQRLPRSPFLPFSSLTPKIFVPAQTRDISLQIGSRPIFRHATTEPPLPLRAQNTCPERNSFAGHSRFCQLADACGLRLAQPGPGVLDRDPIVTTADL